jgi:prepilin-type N-terminal cleavage/methylation domain-containing protein
MPLSLRPSRRLTLTPGGFTLVELMLGLMISSMVMAALAAFSLATASHWRATTPAGLDGTASASGATVQSLYLSRRLASARIQDVLRPMKQAGLVRAGTVAAGLTQPAAAVMLRARSSTNDPTQLYTTEVALMEHDRPTHTIRLYCLKSGVTPQALSNIALTDPSAPEQFKTAWQGQLDVIILAHDVAGARFALLNRGSTVPRPMLEFVLSFQRGQQSATEYGAATMRVPLPDAKTY